MMDRLTIRSRLLAPLLLASVATSEMFADAAEGLRPRET
jgi:hypothetical protein